jgi:dolichyl-phosphate-mannose--protein O-mannosyl transferase
LPAALAYGAVQLSVVGLQHPSYAPSIGETVADKAPASPFQASPFGQIARQPRQPSYGITDVLGLQSKMLQGQVELKERALGYDSDWWSWPLMIRPIWYYSNTLMANRLEYHETLGEGIVLLGNPLIMWGGFLAALIAIAIAFVRRGSPAARDGAVLVCLYLASFASWALMPRKTMFYYYYFPAGMVLSMLLVWLTTLSRAKWVPKAAWAFVGLSGAIFVFFYPVLSSIGMSIDALRLRIWLFSWI